jgi:hypothetical protein
VHKCENGVFLELGKKMENRGGIKLNRIMSPTPQNFFSHSESERENLKHWFSQNDLAKEVLYKWCMYCLLSLRRVKGKRRIKYTLAHAYLCVYVYFT